MLHGKFWSAVLVDGKFGGFVSADDQNKLGVVARRVGGRLYGQVFCPNSSSIRAKKMKKNHG